MYMCICVNILDHCKVSHHTDTKNYNRMKESKKNQYDTFVTENSLAQREKKIEV